jgi:hypothetical protein
MSIPDFLFIGPSKTASTWLYKVLNEHPLLRLPRAKDVYYFDQFYERSFDWYCRQFPRLGYGELTGEFSHDYIYNPIALDRIATDLPGVRLILCARNPYERTQSGIKFLRRNGYGFEPVSVLVEKHTELIEGSLYGRNLQLLLDRFDREQILILDYAQLQDDPEGFVAKISNFLGIDFYSTDLFYKKVNPSRDARNRYLSFVVKRLSLLARSIGFGSLVGMIKMNVFVNLILFKKPADGNILNREDTRFLQQYFDEDIDLFCRLSGVDYSEWKVGDE